MRTFLHTAVVAILLFCAAACSSGLPNTPDSGVGVGDSAVGQGGDRMDSGIGMDSTIGADTSPAMDSMTVADTSSDSAMRADTGPKADSEAGDTGAGLDSATDAGAYPFTRSRPVG